VLKPLLDSDASGLVPHEAPVAVSASMEGDDIVVLRDGQPTPRPAPPESEDRGPATSAAEAVTARLSSLFQEPGEEPQALPGFLPLEDPMPAFLRVPEAEPEEDREEEPGHDEPATGDGELRGRDLFDPAVADDLAADAGEPSETASADEQDDERYRSRLVIDDAAPYEFVPPVVQPLPAPTQGGMLTLVALAVLGLVFFGGGIFWATNARPVANSVWLGPRLVGGLAGIAGVGFFVVAIYFLLDRLGRASERRARERR
jgi:lysozyme